MLYNIQKKMYFLENKCFKCLYIKILFVYLYREKEKQSINLINN